MTDKISIFMGGTCNGSNWRNRHTSPFEMCELKLLVRVPMGCWRQWIRHRAASVNEYSNRYSEAIDSMAATGADKWRRQVEAAKRTASRLWMILVRRSGTKVKPQDCETRSMTMILRRIDMSHAEDLLIEVTHERDQQDAKWGRRDHHPLKWLSIMSEEIDGAARGIIECTHESVDKWANYRNELLQVAAVAIAAIENHDRNRPSPSEDLIHGNDGDNR